MKKLKKLGEKVYSDVWGPSKHLTTDKKSFYVSFIDDYSRESVIYLMSSKDQVFAKYKLYKARKGTKHRLTIHDTPKQNSVAEWLNQTLVKRSRAILIESNLLKSL